MEADLTTTDYIVTEDDIKAVKIPSKDVAKDELVSEAKLVEAIVSKWNEIVEVSENKTIQFALIVNNLLKDFPEEKKRSIMLKVVKHRKLKTSISKDRIYQGLRLIQHRPDLISFKEGKPVHFKPYLKEDGSVFWEFYFNLYKYNLGNDTRVRLEKTGKDNKWSVRDLVCEINKERNGSDRNTRKHELISEIIAIIKNIKDISRLEKIKDKAIAEQKNDRTK